MLSARTFVLVLLIVLVCLSPVYAARHATCYVTWDDYFLYAAFDVPKTNVESSNFDHMSKPWEDDAVEVFVETDGSKSQVRTPKTFQMSVSAGGGSSWLVGENGLTIPKKIYSFKYASRVKGTLNKSSDTDLGYTVELAMPWSDMGGTPKPGTIMGFNIVCRLKGETPAFASLSQKVKTESDIQSPEKWASIKFIDSPTVLAIENGTVVCRKVKERPPVIDGNPTAVKWSRDMGLFIDLPQPSTPEVNPQMVQLPNQEKFVVSRLSLATYTTNNKIKLTDTSLVSTGESVSWHKYQLNKMAKTGIDVSLPTYAGNSREIASIVQGLKELKDSGECYPFLGAYLNVDTVLALHPTTAGVVQDTREAFYGMIRDYFLQVPMEFRALVQLPADKGAKRACIVALSNTSNMKNIDQSVIKYANEQFSKDFGGLKLLWIGSSDYRSNSITLDGYTGYPAALSTKSLDENGCISMARISPVPAPGKNRSDISTYKSDWNDICGRSMDWVLIDSWNDFDGNSEICPSSEYGEVYSDATQIELIQFNSMHPYNVRFLGHDVPSVMVADELYQIGLNLKNIGLKPWYAEDGVFLAARWYKEGVLYSDPGVRLPIQEKGLVGRVISKTVGVRTVDNEGKPLSSGDYELRFDLVRGKDQWFSDSADLPLSVPVKIGTPQPGFTLVSSTLPTIVKSGAEYEVLVKVRNDGPTPWKAGAVKLSYLKARASKASESAQVFAVENTGGSAAVAISKDLEVGRIAEVRIPVACKDCTPDFPYYGLVWTVSQPDQAASELPVKAVAIGSPGVEVPGYTSGSYDSYVAADPNLGLRITGIDAPQEIRAGKKFAAGVALGNHGTDTWEKERVSVQLVWKQADSSVGSAVTATVSANVKAYNSANVKAQLTAPDTNGCYTLYAVLKYDGGFVDVLPANIRIVKGKNPVQK